MVSAKRTATLPVAHRLAADLAGVGHGELVVGDDEA